jgi:hypothetical protein
LAESVAAFFSLASAPAGKLSTPAEATPIAANLRMFLREISFDMVQAPFHALFGTWIRPHVSEAAKI